MNFLFVSDLHLRDTSPRCRTDNFLAAQGRKLDWILSWDGPVVIAGDIFDRWTGATEIRRSPVFMREVLQRFQARSKAVFVVAGQHDLPHHRLDDLEDSALGVLLLTCRETVYLLGAEPITCGGIDFYGASWGEDIPVSPPGSKDGLGRSAQRPKVLVTHRMVWQGRRPPFPGAEGSSGLSLLKAHPEYSIIHTGDNHQSFMEGGGAMGWLINSGSVMRTSASQADHKPSAYAWDGEGRLKILTIPHEKGVVDIESLEDRQEDEKRLSAFVKRLGGAEVELELSFEENMSRYLQQNKLPHDVKSAVLAAMEA